MAAERASARRRSAAARGLMVGRRRQHPPNSQKRNGGARAIGWSLMDAATPPSPDTPLVGLIANPVASKDIRRLVGLARVVDVEEKANLVARLLVGMTAGPALRVAALDDGAGLVRRALRLTRSSAPPLEFLPLQAEATESDTRRAAALLAEKGAAAVVTVGGDGTIRSAVEGWPTARLVPVAAGTNNAIAIAEEPTAIGYAVALAVRHPAAAEVFTQLTALSVDTGASETSTALVDVVGVHTHWTGARALWEPHDLVEAVITNARPTAVGIASVATALGPLAPGQARYVRFGPGTTVLALLGPGLVSEVSVAEHRDVPRGTRIDLDPMTRVVALDGERRGVRTAAHVHVVAGPQLLMVSQALQSRGVPD